MCMALSNRVRRATALFLLAITSLYLTTCNFYKVSTYGQNEIVQIEHIQSKKILLLHNGSQLYRIGTLKLNPTRDTMGIVVQEAPFEKTVFPKTTTAWGGATVKKVDTIFQPPAYYTPNPAHYRYIPGKQPTLIQEVHFFLKTYDPELRPGTIQMPVTAVDQIHVVERDIDKSRVNTMLIVASTLGAFGLLTIIALLTKSSCPYIYAQDSTGLAFQGEVYSGAVMQSAERHDFMALPGIRPYKGKLHVRIANELQERQYVNLAELHAVMHPSGSRVLLDPTGNPQIVTHPVAPSSARSALGEDQQALLAKRDLQAYIFGETEAVQNQLQLQFNRPEGSKQAKLVLRAKNTLWFDQLYARFAEKAGAGYPALMARMAKMSREERMVQQQQQDFPLAVYLKSDDGQWVRTGQFPLTGPMGWREMVLPLDISKIRGNIVELRLETGFLFWEVDFAGIDFSDNPVLGSIRLQAKSARDEKGVSQTARIHADDTLYLEQPQPGSHTDLQFAPLNAQNGQQVSYFLHIKGYYEHIRNFTNTPDVTEVGKFRQPHYFDKFSREEYHKLSNTTWKASDL
jgi:hypothetical protein